MVRSLWAELGEVWLTGVLLGWVVDREDWFGLVVDSVVVAVGMEYVVSVRMECGKAESGNAVPADC